MYYPGNLYQDAVFSIVNPFYATMSALYQSIINDLTSAMKAKDSAKVQVLRSIKAKILEKEISERKGSNIVLSDEQVIEVLTIAAKQRLDSIAQYEQAGRSELALAERYEEEVIRSYLPKQLSDEEIANIVDETIVESEASGPSDMGRVMGAIMPKIRGRADGGAVNRIVREKLISL